MPTDTHPGIARKHIELLRALTPERRLGIAARMTEEAVRASRAGILRAHPELNALEVRLLWAEIHYGLVLSALVRARIAAPRTPD